MIMYRKLLIFRKVNCNLRATRKRQETFDGFWVNTNIIVSLFLHHLCLSFMKFTCHLPQSTRRGSNDRLLNFNTQKLKSDMSVTVFSFPLRSLPTPFLRQSLYVPLLFEVSLYMNKCSYQRASSTHSLRNRALRHWAPPWNRHWKQIIVVSLSIACLITITTPQAYTLP